MPLNRKDIDAELASIREEIDQLKRRGRCIKRASVRLRYLEDERRKL